MSRSNAAGPKAELIDCWRWRPPMENDLTLKEAALKLGFVSEAEFDRAVDPKVKPYIAAASAKADAA